MPCPSSPSVAVLDRAPAPADGAVDRDDAAAQRRAADFGAAVSQQRPYLVRYARRHLNDWAQVEDVVQETLLAALLGAERFESRSSLRTWLTGILVRRIADHVRSHARQRARPAAAAESPDAADGDDHDPAFEAHAGATGEAVDWLDPQRRLESRQLIDALAEGLAALPPIAARVFALRELDGLGNEATASALGLTPGHAAVLLHRARTRLRAGLAQESANAPARVRGAA